MTGADAVEAYLASIGDERAVADARELMAVMARISGADPTLWNVGTIGYDSYHFAYDSGREGDSHVLGFYPRKGKLTVYLMDGTSRHAEALATLGRHSTSRVCVYIKSLADVDMTVLERILRDSHRFLKDNDGSVGRVTP